MLFITYRFRLIIVISKLRNGIAFNRHKPMRNITAKFARNPYICKHFHEKNQVIEKALRYP